MGGSSGGSSRRAPRLRSGQALTISLPHHGVRNLQLPPNCCKTNPVTVTGLAKVANRSAEAPNLPLPPRWLYPPTPQAAADGGARDEQ